MQNPPGSVDGVLAVGAGMQGARISTFVRSTKWPSGKAVPTYGPLSESKCPLPQTLAGCYRAFRFCQSDKGPVGVC